MTDVTDDEVAQLAGLLAGGGVVVLSGAGVSTASGIPDYRGVTGRTRTRPPMTWAEFDGSDEARRRYWAGAAMAAARFADVGPNAAHAALAALEHEGLVDAVVTQNVDGLHQRAGSRAVVEVHGSLRWVSCRGCGDREPRGAVVERLLTRNPSLRATRAQLLADGDAAVDGTVVGELRLVGCLACGGPLRPDVVFFGELVPRATMQAARAHVASARVLLVVGTSLTVGSGRMLVRVGLRAGARVAVVNLGETRADDVAQLRLEGDVGAVLDRVVARLGVGPLDGTGRGTRG